MLSDKSRTGFTLIEVAVCAAVLSFSILTALAIIPRGLVIQNESRMRAVASACIQCMASDAFNDTIVNKWLKTDPILPSFSAINWNGQQVGVGVRVSVAGPNTKTLPDGTIITIPGGDSKVYRMNDFNSTLLTQLGISAQLNSTPSDGRLDRRIIYTVESTTTTPNPPGFGAIYPKVNEITAWLLNKDPAQFPTEAKYLATYVEQAALPW